MNSTYCNDVCPIGKAAKAVFLDLNNSVYDAVFDFKNFTANCKKQCPFKSYADLTKGE